MAIDGPDDDPTQCHYEMGYEGRGRIMIGGEWNEWMRSPASVGGHQHHEHARRGRPATSTRTASGPAPPAPRSWSSRRDQFYGDRVYRCTDLEGHHWTFAMHVRDVTRAEAEAAIDTPIFATELAVTRGVGRARRAST